jgi:hypothetical protein
MDASGSSPKKDRGQPFSWLCPTPPDITPIESSSSEKSELSGADLCSWIATSGAGTERSCLISTYLIRSGHNDFQVHVRRILAGYVVAAIVVKFDAHALPWLNDQPLRELGGIVYRWEFLALLIRSNAQDLRHPVGGILKRDLVVAENAHVAGSEAGAGHAYMRVEEGNPEEDHNDAHKEDMLSRSLSIGFAISVGSPSNLVDSGIFPNRFSIIPFSCGISLQSNHRI